jgi:hypothetical protein
VGRGASPNGDRRPPKRPSVTWGAKPRPPREAGLPGLQRPRSGDRRSEVAEHTQRVAGRVAALARRAREPVEDWGEAPA